MLYIAYVTGTRIFDYYTPFPIWDYWRVVENLPDMQSGRWGFLWRQHNEHRILFPEVVFTVDMLWWHGRKLLPLIAVFLCYLGTWAVLCLPILRDRNLKFRPSAFACLLAGCVVLWRSAALVLAEPFALPWTMCQFSVAASLLLLVRIRSNGKWTLLAGVIALGVVATYSLGSGMLLWPLLCGMGLLLGLQRKQLATLAASGAVVIGCYFIGYHSSGSLHVGNLVSHPFLTLGFLASYLSMPFGVLGSVEGRAGLIAGTIALSATAISLITCWRRKLLREPAAALLLGFLTFNIMAILLTASGRMIPADVTFGTAKALRYLLVPQMNWGVVILLVLWTAAKVDTSRVFPPLCCLTGLALFIYLPKLEPWITLNAEFFSEGQLAAMSYEDRVPDEKLAFDRVYPDTHLTAIFNKRLEDSQKSIYYRGRSRWLDKPVSRFAPPRPALPGAVTGAFPSGTGILVVGWADDSTLRKPVLWIALTDEDGVIRGFGRRFPAGFPNTASTPSVPPSLGWAGYVPPAMAGRKVFAYAIDSRKFGAMPLATSFRIPQVMPSNAPDRGGSSGH